MNKYYTPAPKKDFYTANGTPMKICRKCKEIYEISSTNFQLPKKSKGLYPTVTRCRECTGVKYTKPKPPRVPVGRDAAYYRARSPRLKVDIDGTSQLKCTHCKTFKTFDNFQNAKTDRVWGKQSFCKECNDAATIANQAKHVSPSVYKLTIMNHNGLKYYFGATKNPPLRRANHKSDLTGTTQTGTEEMKAHFKSDPKSVFNFEILKSFTTMEDAYAYERELLESNEGVGNTSCCNRRTY